MRQRKVLLGVIGFVLVIATLWIFARPKTQSGDPETSVTPQAGTKEATPPRSSPNSPNPVTSTSQNPPGVQMPPPSEAKSPMEPADPEADPGLEDKTSRIFPKARVIAEKKIRTSEGGEITSRILETDFKYKKIRAFEERSANGQLVRQEFMVADHILVTLESENAYEPFVRALSALKSEVLKRQNPTLLLVKVPNADSPDAFEKFREAISQLKGIKYAPDPDRIRTLF